MALALVDLRLSRNLLGHGPHASHQRTGQATVTTVACLPRATSRRER
jgi:hypothetical protein